MSLTGRGEPLQVPALDVSSNFFATLGVTPARGRAFLTGAAAPDDDGSVIVSDRLWAYVTRRRSVDHRTVDHRRRRPPDGRRGPAARLSASGRSSGAAHCRTLTFEVTPTDPVAFTTVTLLLLAVGLIAAWLPARRATRIDPWAARRAD